MKILGIDTSSKFLSLAISEDKDIIRQEDHLLDRKHASLMIPEIKKMLEHANLSVDDIDAFVIGLGPGSFTGLRIGVSTVKGFGIATKKPCIGVPSIDALALNIDEKDSNIIPIIDAKRENVYSAIYRKKGYQVIRLSGYQLVTIDKLMAKIRGHAVIFGDGLLIYREKIKHFNKEVVFLDEEYWYPKAGNLIKLALPNIKKGKNIDLSKLKPIYLYPKDCQVIHKPVHTIVDN